MTVTNFAPNDTGSEMSKPLFLKGTRDVDYDVIECVVLNSAEIFIGACVETIQADSDDGRTDITLSSDESKTNLGWVLDDEFNIKRLEIDNSGAEVTKSSKFTAKSKCHVAIPNGHCKLNVPLKAQAAAVVLPGTRMVSAGSGYLKPHPDDLAVSTHTTGETLTHTTTGIAIDPTIAICLSRATTSASVQYIAVKPV